MGEGGFHVGPDVLRCVSRKASTCDEGSHVEPDVGRYVSSSNPMCKGAGFMSDPMSADVILGKVLHTDERYHVGPDVG